MFKKLVEWIIEAEDFNTAFNAVDIAFQEEKIKWKDHQELLKLCEKCFPEE